MKMSKREYGQYVKEMSPKSPLWKDVLLAFLIGGGICTIGQAVLNGFTAMGLDEDNAGTATCITMVFFSAVLTALSLYDNIAKHAGGVKHCEAEDAPFHLQGIAEHPVEVQGKEEENQLAALSGSV